MAMTNPKAPGSDVCRLLHGKARCIPVPGVSAEQSAYAADHSQDQIIERRIDDAQDDEHQQGF